MELFTICRLQGVYDALWRWRCEKQVRLARRASIVLLAADGLDNYRIGEILGVGRIQAGRWRERYAVGGLKAIRQDLPRGGRKPKIDSAEIVRLTTQTKPEGATQWS